MVVIAVNQRTDHELIQALRRNKWTLTYLSVVCTALLIMMIVEAVNTHA